MKTSDKVKLINGYYQLKNKPSKDELTEYYKTKYYQESKGPYQQDYSDKELTYIHNTLRRIHRCCEYISPPPLAGKSFLDVGCGEGWALKYFQNIGCHVNGVDFSSYGIKKFNPELLAWFTEEDIFKFLDKEIRRSHKYDIINLMNIIEHVLDPENLLLSLKNILSPDGILIVVFPNDYSPFQEKLLDLGKTEENSWIAIPDHISYFNKESFSALAQSLDFSIELILADFPIDIFLINDFSNYVKDPAKGKQAHLSRIEIMNFLSELNLDLAVDVFLNFGKMGFGRALTAFMKVQEA